MMTSAPVTTRQIRIEPRFESWQSAARELLREGVPPEAIEWLEIALSEAPAADGEARALDPASAPGPPAAAPSPHRVPRRFVELARQVAGHPSAGRWALLYR